MFYLFRGARKSFAGNEGESAAKLVIDDMYPPMRPSASTNGFYGILPRV